MFDALRTFFKKFQTIREIDEISSMRPLGRDEYKYIEGDHELTVQVELLSGTPERVIYSRTIKRWLPPHENEPITEDERRRILSKMCKYFEINGISYIVE